MLHNQNHLYAIKENDGEIVFIDDVENGIKCGCICSKCKEPLVAKNKGKTDRIHHFAHKSDSKCSGETQAHILAKDIISKEMSLRVPSHKKWQKIKFDNVEVEKLIGDSNYRADLICEKNEKELIVEIEVRNPLSDDKAHFLKENKISTLIIDLKRSLKPEQFNNIPDNFSKIILDEKKNKFWFQNEKLDQIDKAIELVKNAEVEKRKEEQKKIEKEEKRKHEIWKINQQKKRKIFTTAIDEIKKKNQDKLIYGELVRINLNRYGERVHKLSFCIKSPELSQSYGNLAKIQNFFDARFEYLSDGNYFSFWKSMLGKKVGVRIIDDVEKSLLRHPNIFDAGYDEWSKTCEFFYFPHCRVYWIDDSQIEKPKNKITSEFEEGDWEGIDIESVVAEIKKYGQNR